MKKWWLFLACLPFAQVQAGLSVSADGFELGRDCVALEAGGLKMQSERCGSSKAAADNRSVQGSDNPGKGHKKAKKKQK